MVFPKITRKRLQQAGGKPIEIPWPSDAPEPTKGTSYTIQSSPNKTGDDRLRVLDAWEVANGFRCKVKVDADPVRLLAKTSGYVTNAAGALQVKSSEEDGSRLQPEPEAVPAAFQRRLSEEAAIRNAGKQATMRSRQKQLEKEQELLDQRASSSSRSAKTKLRHIRALDTAHAA